MTLALHTGVPGSCKSLMVVDAIEFRPEYSARPLYAHAVDGWERAVQIRCRNPGCRTCRVLTESQKESMHCIDDWFEWIPTGALMVVDEAHYPFPSRREKEMPMSVQRLTEHRHDGVDIWLCTPNSNLLDINVRRLVEQHRHFVKGRLGRYVYTHTECMSTDDMLKSVKRERFKVPTRSFGKYKSADAHVTITAEKPKILYRIPLFIAAAVALVFVSLQQADSLRRSNAPEPVVASDIAVQGEPDIVSTTVDPLSAWRGPDSVGRLGSSGLRPDWSGFDKAGFTPAVPLFPESAPVYRLAPGETLVVPEFVGCIVRERAVEPDCRCYDSNAAVVDTPPSACLYVASGGSREEWLRGSRLRKRSVQAAPSVGSL